MIGALSPQNRNSLPIYPGTTLVPHYPADPLDWIKIEGVGSLPTLAVDFTRSGRVHGAPLVSMIGNLSGIASTGLSYSSAAEVRIMNALLAAIQGAAGTLFVETGPNSSTNFTDIIGLDNVGPLGQGGSAAVANSWNGVAGLNASPNGGQGQSFDTTFCMLALRWNAAGRALCTGGGALVGDTGNIGALRANAFIGRRGDGSSLGSGKVRAIYFWPTALSDTEMQALTFNSVTTRFRHSIYGDSMGAGAGATDAVSLSWRGLLNYDLNATAPALTSATYQNMQAVSGTTSMQALAAMRADTTSRARFTLIWTGHNSPNANQTLSDIQDMVALVRGERRYLILLPCQNSASAVNDAGYRAIVDTRSALRLNFHARHLVDVPAYLAANGNGGSDNAQVALGFTPPSLLADTIHLNNAGHAHVKAVVKAKIVANGWN